ncbi:hypothetical protein D9758_000808 [Tetrapyrgos nigripes]|uniref:LigT-like protein n=1 Tax=Tetrapyrgos nigripes TaxID=182062 RepID=A0A8H5GYJ3_9AGAR|nr:hypothetical protein D9758_000808 [Tetrapyrgos nigripes]
MGVTLWIVPSEQDIKRLRRIMDLRPADSQVKSSASYPKFDPHITLAALPPDANIPLSKLKESIPTALPALEIQFNSVDTGSHFFRSVYIAVRLSPELSELHSKVHAALGVDPRTPSFPHISLCYITDEDAANGERERFRQTLVDSGKLRSNSDGTVSLNCAEAGEEDDWMTGFTSPEIWITTCDGPVEGWIVDDKVPLVFS